MRVSTARELGALVKQRRRELGMSQVALAQDVGVTRQWISALEQGRVEAFGPVLRTLGALGLVLDVVEDDAPAGEGTRVDLDELLSRYDVGPE